MGDDEKRGAPWEFPLAILAIVAGAYAAIPGFWWTPGTRWEVVLLATGAVWLTLSLVALVALTGPNALAFIAGTLRHPRYTQIYRKVTEGGVSWVWDRLCDPTPKNAGLQEQFRGALTWRLYDRAMVVAAAYPILLMVGSWMWSGNDTGFGSATILGKAPLWPDRVSTIVVSLLLLLTVLQSRRLAYSRQGFLRSAADWMPLVAGAAALLVGVSLAAANTRGIAGAGAFAFAVTVTFAGGMVLAYTISRPFAGALSIASLPGAAAIFSFLLPIEKLGATTSAFSAAGAFALVGAALVFRLDQNEVKRAARIFVTLLLPSLWGVAFTALRFDAFSEEGKHLFLFLSVLPLINALFDVVSYSVTLSFLRRGLASRLPTLLGLLDAAVALVLFVALGATLTLLIAAMNRIAGTVVFDLSGLLAGVYAHPEDHWWLYLMIFSTVLPTGLHILVSLLGLQGIVPRFLRHSVADLVEAAPTSPPAVAPFAVGLVWTVPVALLIVAATLCWPLVDDAAIGFGQWYLERMIDLANRVGAL